MSNIILPGPYDGDKCSSSPCCIQGTSCKIKLIHVDENRCEDDIFDIYLIRGDQSWKYITQIDLVSSPAGCCGQDENGNDCPQTRKEVPVTITKDDVNACCKIRIKLVMVGVNCCNTYTRFSIKGPTGAELYSQYFSQGGLDQEFDVRELCNASP